MSNPASAYASEGLFGPPSEPISIQEFVSLASELQQSLTKTNEWDELPADAKEEVTEACSVADLRDMVTGALENPFLYAHIVQNHEDNIDLIRASAKPGGRVKKANKRKRIEVVDSSDLQFPQEVVELRNTLDKIPLKSWPYTVDAAVFMRTPKNSDINVLTEVRKSRPQESSDTAATADDILILISVYNRLSWGNHLSRSSQHAVFSSQTLGDLYESIPCTSNEILASADSDPNGQHYDLNAPKPHCGAVMVIENVAYGDGLSEEDYSDKLLSHVNYLPQRKRPQVTKGSGMHDQVFSGLSLRVNSPYWLLHQGNCEHFLVVDQIRFLHPSDPGDGYPLTLHISPPVIDLCQACSKVPATLSIVGDVRLGQSPCKFCEPCWRFMGLPKDNDNVVVVPLPRYEHGWH